MFSPADSLNDSRRKRSGIRERRLETARDLEDVGARADRLHTFHNFQQKRTAVLDCCRLEAARDLENVGPREDGLHTSRKRTVIRDCRMETLCDLENVVSPSFINPLVSGFSPFPGPGEIFSGKCTPSLSDVAGAPSSPNVSITGSSPMFEELRAENTSHLPHEESGGDADEVTSPLYPTGRLRDLKADGGSNLPRSRSECSMVTSTHVAVVNKGTGEDLNSYLCKDEEDFQPSSIVWTDDKHSSYLSSMEDQFVRNMFEREFCAVDVCGQAPEHTDSSEIDSVESQLSSLHDGATSGLGKLKAWRNGSWRPVVLKRHIIGGVGSSAVVFRNPWIKRFRPSTIVRTNIGTDRRQSQNGGSSSILGDHDIRSLTTGACKRLKAQQLREHQGGGTSTVSQNRGWTAGARKRLKVEEQREHQGAFTDSRDRARKFGGLPSALPHICEEEVEQQGQESLGQ